MPFVGLEEPQCIPIVARNTRESIASCISRCVHASGVLIVLISPIPIDVTFLP